jgi:hypothetical protein
MKLVIVICVLKSYTPLYHFSRIAPAGFLILKSFSLKLFHRTLGSCLVSMRSRVRRPETSKVGVSRGLPKFLQANAGTDSTEQSPSREANSCSASDEIPSLFWNLKIQLPRSPEPVIGSYPEPSESSPHATPDFSEIVLQY